MPSRVSTPGIEPRPQWQEARASILVLHQKHYSTTPALPVPRGCVLIHVCILWPGYRIQTA